MGKVIEFGKGKVERSIKAQEPIVKKLYNDTLKVTLNAEEIYILLKNYLNTIESFLEDYKENHEDFQGSNLEETKAVVKYHLDMVRKLMNRLIATNPCLETTMQWSVENLFQSCIIVAMSDGMWEMEFGDFTQLKWEQKQEVHLYTRLKTLYDGRSDTALMNPFLDFIDDNEVPESIIRDIERMEKNLAENREKYYQEFQQKEEKVVLLEEGNPYIKNKKGSKTYFVKEYSNRFISTLQDLSDKGTANEWKEVDVKREKSFLPQGWRIKVLGNTPIHELLGLDKVRCEVVTRKQQEKLFDQRIKRVAQMDRIVHRMMERCRKAGF